MRIVNGYSCATCTEEAAAKRGLDPSKSATAALAEKRGIPDVASPDFRTELDRALAVTGARSVPTMTAPENPLGRLSLYA